jgi:hypothetical protein
MARAKTGRFSGVGFAVLLASVTPLTGFNGNAGAKEFSVSVRSIDEVSDGKVPLVAEITSSEAVLVFVSNRALACSVVFGETRKFGRVAVDQDMDGGAHSDHHPPLTGLKPATEYYFRVQGTAADGTLYVGEIQSFRTLAQTTGGPVNLAALAAGARVGAVSSNYGGAKNEEPWGANSAIDGSRSTAWSSSGDGNDAFIEIELAERAHVDRVSVWTRAMSDGTARIEKFTLTSDRGKVFGPFELPGSDKAYQFAIDEAVRSLRLDVLQSTGGNVGLIEFSVYHH